MERNAFEAAVAAGVGDWPAGTVLLAAVSGGADSSAMLAALAGPGDGSFDLCCVHVEHGIRPAAESRSDAAATEALCAKLSVPCAVVSIPPGRIARAAKRRGLGLEAAARLYRHAAWNAEARRVGAAKILVAHTRDDLLETVLMRVLRGSGPAGLAAMPREKGRVLRPLLETTRSDVLAYLEERGVSYRVDSTNADPAFLRNRIRLKLIPCLDEWFPSWRKTLADLAETQRLVADFLAAEAAARIPWEDEAAGLRRTDRDNFFSQPAILREEALFAVLDRFSGGRASGPPRRKALRVFTRGKAGSLDLGRAVLQSDARRVTLTLPRRGERGFSLLIKEPGIYKLKWLRIRAFPGETGKNAKSPFPLKGQGFFACPPVALRRRYPEDFVIRDDRKHRGAEMARGAAGLIVVEDALGPAAFIAGRRDGSVAVLAGEDKDRAQQESCLFFAVQERGAKTDRLEPPPCSP
ncbi:MAG: tRNA lysidine(34) synthetase TilS [Treponema sp.]|jgi:tRNA(Ile)-lysidine synthase|nr:tRNA lysidine(34) synthetase TilS [Treponema sp.]